MEGLVYGLGSPNEILESWFSPWSTYDTNVSVQPTETNTGGSNVSVQPIETNTGGGGSELPAVQEQRKVNKRKSDQKFRGKLKDRMLWLQGLVPGCSEVKGQARVLECIIDYIQSVQQENHQLKAENSWLKEQQGWLGQPHQHPSVSTQLCSLETNELQNQQGKMLPVNATSTMLQGGIVLPNNAEYPQLNATEAPIDACLQVQEIPQNNERECESSEEERRGTCGSDNEFSGGAEHEPSALDGTSGEPNGDASYAAAAMPDILKKLEADDESTVKISDFTGLDGERINVGKYSVPLSLRPIVENITNVYGDISVTAKMNPSAAETNFIMVCAAVKEMNEIRLEQVTEDRMLKWRDAINDAKRSNFKVDFAEEQLKKIAQNYTDYKESLKQKNADLRMFKDEPVTAGKQPISDNEIVNGGDYDVCRPPAGKKRQRTAAQVRVANKPETKKRKFRLGNKGGQHPQ